MPIVTRIYHLVGTTDPYLQRFVSPVATVVASRTDSTVSIDVDDAPDNLQTLDDYMESLGFLVGALAVSQHFIYTATGLEGDSFDIPITLRTSLLYIAQVTLANQPGGLYTVEAPVSGYALASIHLNTGVPVSAGDIFAISIFERS